MHVKPPSALPAGLLLAVLALLASDTTALQAEDVYVTAYFGSGFNTCPPSCAYNLGAAYLSSSVSIACPVTRDHSVYGSLTNSGWAVTPTLTNNPGVYRIFVTKGTSTSCPADLLVQVTATAGDLADATGTAQTTFPTTAFQGTNSVNSWTLVGHLTNKTAQPSVTFAYASGGVSRFYMDAVDFQSVDATTLPVITQQPQSLTVTNGNPVSFTINASSLPPMGYQWQKNGTNVTDGGDISGSSTSTLTMSTITLNDAGNYTVLITNSYGSVTSSVAVLTVIRAAPAIITPPTASAITYGQTLASSILNGGVASTPGVFAFVITDLAPNAGITNVSVIFTPTDPTNYTTVILNVNVTVNKATGTVTLGGLYQIYDGRAMPVNVTTMPSGLNVQTTYNGSSAAPTNVGIYTVIGTIMDANYQGSATDTLVIADPAQAVNLLVNSGFETPPGNAQVVATDWTYFAPPTLSASVKDYWVANQGSGNGMPPESGTYFWKQWGALYAAPPINNVAGLYQTFSSAPGAIYQASGWLSTSDSDTLGADCVTWIEVAFLGAGSNALALYKSPDFSASVGTSTWFQYQVTNACDLTSPVSTGDPYFTTYAVTGSVSQLVAPLGTTAVRYRYAFLQVGREGGSAFLDDAVLNQFSGPNLPVITQQPQSLTVTNGNPASFTISASSLSPMGYQWQKDGTTLTDGGNTAGSSTSTLTVSTITLNDAGNYTVVITNSYGSVTSSVATLTVIPATPAIITPPTASAITYGQTLASSILSGGVASTPGAFAFVNTNLAPNAGITNVSVIFTPIDSTNYTISITNVTVTVNRAAAIVNIDNLTQIYDGTAKSVIANTTPTNLTVGLIYNGSADAPVNAGNYTVVGTVNDLNYQGSATNTLVISQAAATVNVSNLSQLYDGTARPVSVATTPFGLNVLATYNGSSAAPTNAGTYTVIGTIVAANYQGSATNTLVISQATATVTLGGLYQGYDGTAKCANASTSPPGLSVSLAYNGSTTCPSAVGGYTVIGTVNEANYEGSTTNTLTIYAVAPVIVQHPQSQAVESGTNTTLTVVATGAPLNYQWFQGGTALTGATSATLSFNPVVLTNADIYCVVVSNSSGVAVSSNAVLAVRPPGAPILRVDGDLVVGSVSLIGSASVTMESSYVNGEIFYTLDGSAPDFGSVLYGGAIILTNSAVVRALGLNLDTFDSAEAPAVTVNILPTYGLVLTANGSGTVVANPFPGPYASNTVVTVTANPAAGWQFEYWTGDASGNANPVAVTMDGPLNVQAVFVQVAYPVVATTAGGGSVSVSPVQANYLSNMVVSVTATASNGWTFVGWTGNASGTNNPLSLTVDAPESLAAVFGTTVNTNVIGGGIIELDATNPIPYGTIVRATGVPNYGSYFVSWGNTLSGTNNPAEFTVTSTNPVRALFTTLPPNSAALTVRVNGEGDVSVSPPKAYYAVGDSVTLNAIPRGMTNLFVSWSGDFVSTANPAILTLNTSKVVTASFSPLVLPPVITSSLTETGLVGTVFSYQITASSVPTSYGASGLPLGLSVISTNGLLSGTPQSAGNYVVTISASNIGGTGSATLALSIGTPVYPPTIVQSPSDQTVSSGATVTFSVVATGTSPLTYQWRKGGFGLPAATDATLVLANVSSSDAAAYDVVVTNSYGSATSALAQLTIYDAPAARIFVVPTNGTSGQTIAVSVCLAALGNENALSFSLTFDPSLLSYQGVVLGSGVSGGSLLANSSALGAGQIGLGISLGTGSSFGNTTQEIAAVQFSINPVAATTSAVLGFGDQPTARLVGATNAVALASTFQGGNIVITPADYEGDVFPPGAGDHVLDIRDWIREGFLVAGLETVTNQDEFLRADCAPLADKGDGILTVADWVQVGRFAVGLDPVTVVGGPIAGKSLVTPLVKVVPHGLSPSAPALWISSTNVLAGASVGLAVFLNAAGNENAAGFSVSFDPTQLTLTSLTAGSGAGNATFIANTNGAAQGQVGAAVSLSSGGAWGEGSQELAVLAFTANAGGGGAVPVILSDTVVRRAVADATAQSLTAVYTNGMISIITLTPQLSIALVGTNVTLSWPAALSNYVLQSAANLGAGEWNTNLGPPSVNGKSLFITLPATNQQQFYRLSQ